MTAPTLDPAAVPTRTRVLLLAVLLGVLATVVAMTGVLLGGVAAGVVGAALLALLLAVAGRARRAQLHASRRAAGHTCSCCATSQFDGVRVV